MTYLIPQPSHTATPLVPPLVPPSAPATAVDSYPSADPGPDPVPDSRILPDPAPVALNPLG